MVSQQKLLLQVQRVRALFFSTKQVSGITDDIREQEYFMRNSSDVRNVIGHAMVCPNLNIAYSVNRSCRARGCHSARQSC